MNIYFFHLIFPGANIFLVLRPPPPNKFCNGPSLIISISHITDTGVSSAVRVIGVSVIARCPQGES